MADHYSNGWEVGEFITNQNLSFYEGCIVKYICRYKNKDGLKDLLKVQDYLNKVIENYKETMYHVKDENGS